MAETPVREELQWNIKDFFFSFGGGEKGWWCCR